MTKIQVTNAHSKIPTDVLELLRTLAYQCENFNNGNHSGSFVGVEEALDFIEQVDTLRHPCAPDIFEATVVMPEIGDYCLATKYSDGDPGDHWGLGFYDGERDGRHYIKDSNGKQIRANGFRRVGKVSAEVGHWLLNTAAKPLEASPPGTVNLWTMLTAIAYEADEA